MIQVIIERYIADGMLSTYEDCSKKALFQTYSQDGFISAETLTDIDNPNHKFVKSKWQSQQAWLNWAKSKERVALLNTISPMLSQRESVTIVQN